MKFSKVLFALGAMATLAMFPLSLTAQSSANGDIPVSASVQTVITATPIRGLVFGSVLPGLAKTVNHNDATTGTTNPGAIRFDGAGGAALNVTFSALTQLTAGAENLPFSYASQGGTNDVDDATTSVNFDPSAAGGLNTTLPASTNSLFIFLGGVVTPGATQATGSYTGIVTVTATYTGI